ncbi:GDSL esterase/lipase At5g55050-like [Gastrolobium bilobum]|uniref:GDSL esterase/lipase At5g55050-like n=1 Tax=Gastrolobium bilobum TaxID=150636 RepID=UPI002AB0B1B8|nr:GDSL esterase/lipase At5g55050-like [Gastrolobium bilobum]
MASFATHKCFDIANNNASVFFFLLFSLAMIYMHVAHGVEDKPILFIFGDSTFDVGTNNFLRSKAKANFPYNGIDFPHSVPTGRFSNGFNTADQIARQFGYQKSPPPFLALEKLQYSFKRNILHGVNFASGGSGILRQTGFNQSGEVVYLEKQVQQFALVRGNIREILGPAKAACFVSKALFLISVGSNDLFDFAGNDSGIHMGQEEYLAIIQLNYYSHIVKLYELGARKFGILSVPPIGCCPALSFANGGNCVTPLNDLAVAFYSAIRDLLRKLSSELEDLEYSLANTFAMTMTLLNDPLAFGLKDTKSACCGSGKFNGEGPCIKAPNTNLCLDRRDHLFWDLFHPTETATGLAAKTLFEGGNEFVIPVNFSQLISSY